jgi:hypothetical protein
MSVFGDWLLCLFSMFSMTQKSNKPFLADNGGQRAPQPVVIVATDD